MTLQQAVKELYPTEEELADRYTVAYPDNTQDLINRIQRDARYAVMD